MSKGMLFSEMRPEPEWEARFNTWYDTDHIPVRMALEGFEGAQRYRSLDNDNYLVTYDLTALSALKTPGYERVKTEPTAETDWMLANVGNFTRYLGSEIGREGQAGDAVLEAPYVFCALFDVPEEDKPAFDAWMTEDHMPLLLQNPGWLGVRRFDLTVGEPVPFTRLAIHYLASLEPLSSPEREAARNSDWRQRMVDTYPWFSKGQYGRFERHGRRYRNTGAYAFS